MKPFDQKLHDDNDQLCREIVLQYLKFDGKHAIENIFNRYGVDILLVEQRDSSNIAVVGTVEVERKLAWGDSDFPYVSVRIPARKLKFSGCFYIIINEPCTQMLFISPEVMSQASIEQTKNRYSPDLPESFLAVDPSKCEVIDIHRIS